MSSSMRTVIRVLLFGVLAISLFSYGDHVNGQSADVIAIKNCVVDYFRFARAKDKTGVESLLSRTPNEYWKRRERGAHAESDANESATANSFEPLDDLSFRALTGLTFLVAGKARLDRDHIRPVIINGRLAKASVLLDLGNEKSREDFLLQKLQGKWTIFRIDKPDATNTFPR